ncbi:MAG: Multidrug resistance protein MdtC [Luteibacter sp.]|nr:MAG: Multidrug resistance protein MdtC [Luteibacter sp.]
MPDEDTGLLQAEVTADANISPEVMSGRLKRVGEIMQNDPAVMDVTTILGGDNGGAVGNSGMMFIDLKPKGNAPGQRRDTIKQVMERLGKTYEKLADVQVFMTPMQFLGGGGNSSNRGQYSFQLISTDGEDLQPWALKLVRQMRTMKEFRDVGSDFDVVGKQQMLTVDRDTANRLNVTMGLIDTALNNAFGQSQVSIIYSDINQYWVVLTATAAQTLTPEALLNTYVKSSTGKMVPLSAVAKMMPRATPMAITHQNQLESADIT